MDSGETTRVGDLHGDKEAASSIAFDRNGTLYGLNNLTNAQGSGNKLYTIEHNHNASVNGKMTFVSKLTGPQGRATSIRFAPDGTLWAISQDGNGVGRKLFKVDPSNGSTSAVVTLANQTKASTLAVQILP